jgi:predicted dehydrogenase
MTNSAKITRRQVLKSAAAAVPTIISASALGRERPAPSERINIGMIGFGARGHQVLRDFLPLADAQIVAICDVQRLHYREQPWGKGPPLGREAGKQAVESHYANAKTSGTYSGCATFSDYRELCGREDIDAVIVTTPDHWHALQSLQTLKNGKDLYCEKPFTHFFAEAEVVCREAASRQAVVQVGSQQRSDALFRQAVELVRNGHLGTVQRVEVGLPAGYAEPQGEAEIAVPPAELDYEMWCGPAPKLPYMRARHHRWWRGSRAYGGGTLMDWIGHHNDIALWGIGAERSGPLQVEAVGWTRSKTEVYDTPVDFNIHCEYPGGVNLAISSQLEQGAKWIGSGGWLWVNRGKIRASDPRWLQAGFDRGPWKAYASKGHAQNFLDCVKSRGECVAPPDIAHRSITPGHLAYVSNLLGRALRWDATRQQIVNDDAAQQLLQATPYRAPWKIV